MEPENIEVKPERRLNQVTPLSKYLAMVLFVVLPFVGFWLGLQFQPHHASAPVPVQFEQKVATSSHTFSAVPLVNYPDFEFTEILPSKTITLSKSEYAQAKEYLQHREIVARYKEGISSESYVSGKAVESYQAIRKISNGVDLDAYSTSTTQEVLEYYFKEMDRLNFLYSGSDELPFQSSGYQEQLHYFTRTKPDATIETIVLSIALEVTDYTKCNSRNKAGCKVINEVYKLYYLGNLKTDSVDWRTERIVSPSGTFEAIISSTYPQFTCDYLRPDCKLSIRNIKTGKIYYDGGFKIFDTRFTPTLSGWETNEDLILMFTFGDGGETSRSFDVFKFKDVKQTVESVVSSSIGIKPCNRVMYKGLFYSFREFSIDSKNCGPDGVDSGVQKPKNGFSVFTQNSYDGPATFSKYLPSVLEYMGSSSSKYIYQIGDFMYDKGVLTATVGIAEYEGDINDDNRMVLRDYGVRPVIASSTITLELGN